jgi:hypothetical protein
MECCEHADVRGGSRYEEHRGRKAGLQQCSSARHGSKRRGANVRCTDAWTGGSCGCQVPLYHTCSSARCLPRQWPACLACLYHHMPASERAPCSRLSAAPLACPVWPAPCGSPCRHCAPAAAPPATCGATTSDWLAAAQAAAPSGWTEPLHEGGSEGGQWYMLAGAGMARCDGIATARHGSAVLARMHSDHASRLHTSQLGTPAH